MKNILLAQAGEQSKRHLRDFVWSFRPVWFPVGLKKRRMERVEERVRMRELPVFSHTSLQILLLPKLASLGTDCHASLPSMDNQSFFEEPSMGSPLLLAIGKTQILGNFTALHISHVRRNFIWPQLQKLIKTCYLLPAEHVRNLFVFQSFWFRKTLTPLYVVPTVSSAACT